MKASAGTDMRWQWSRFEQLGVDGVYDALALRSRVFVLEQQCVFLDADGHDRHAWHLLGRDADGLLQAVLRVVDPGRKCAEPSMGRVITAPESRGTGLGHLLVAEGIARSASVWRGQAIRIGAQARLEAFYAGHGFQTVGEPYIEDGIPHLEMLRVARLADRSLHANISSALRRTKDPK